MIEKNVFSYIEYRAFLRDLEEAKGAARRGFWSEVAKATGCQPSYISRILGERADFSQEQTLRLCRFLTLTTDESDYLLGLVEHAKAGTSELKAYYENKLALLREKNLHIQSRVRPSVGMSPEVQAIFYSQWYYLAIHVLLLNPAFRTVESIASGLALSPTAVERVLRFLTEHGLAQLREGKFYTGSVETHLAKESPHIFQHHTNWRLAVVDSLRHPNEHNVHYSGVSSLSEEVIAEIRARFVQIIQEYVELVKPAADETLYCFNLDFFKLLK